jgi:hypothetical protein
MTSRVSKRTFLVPGLLAVALAAASCSSPPPPQPDQTAGTDVYVTAYTRPDNQPKG